MPVGMCTLVHMAQRRIPVRNPQKLATYYKDRDGWHVQLRHGARVIRNDAVESKEVAIEQTKALLEQFPGTTYELCVLGECWAWKTPDGWVYAREAGDPNAERVRVLDNLGAVVLQRGTTGYTQFIDGAKPTAASAGPAASASSE